MVLFFFFCGFNGRVFDFSKIRIASFFSKKNFGCQNPILSESFFRMTRVDGKTTRVLALNVTKFEFVNVTFKCETERAHRGGRIREKLQKKKKIIENI